MKKLFAFFTVAALLTFSVNNFVFAQDNQEDNATETTEQIDTSTQEADTAVIVEEATETLAAPVVEEEAEIEKTFHQILKEKFIQGGAGFMAIVLVCLILGLGLCIERIIYLNLSTTDAEKLLDEVRKSVETGGYDAAKEICKDTRGPVAGIFYQGLDRADEGLDAVEKTIMSYGSVLMGRLEKGLSWISLFIALAPMLGFMGTVIGMISAFDMIEAAGDISPTVVAGGIKVALLTTVFGLIVAIILQIFYNYIVAKIDSIVNTMENSTIEFMDILLANKSK